MARYVVDLNQELGKTVIMIEHDMGVVMDISHRVMVLDFGRKSPRGAGGGAGQRARAARLSGRGRRAAPRGARGPMMDVRTEIVQVHGSTCGWPSTSSVPAEVALHDTLPRMLARNARQSPDLVAQREKEFGIWTAYTWRSVEHHVRRMSDRSCRPGCHVRRRGRVDRRQPPGVGLGRDRRACLRGPEPRHLSRCAGGRDCLSASTTPRRKW